MVGFITRRILYTILVIFIVTFIVFILLHIIPGDPILTMLGSESNPEQVEALRKELYLDQSLINQYGHWLFNAVRGDFGKSLYYNTGVMELMASRLPITLYLSSIAMIISIVLGILAGIVSAVRRGGAVDSTITLLANIGVAIPVFWLAVLLVYFFGLKLDWLPVQGYTSPFTNLGQSFREAILPVFMLAIGGIAMTARQTRSSMLEVISQDYIRTARAKGLRERVVIFRHALKNAIIPVVTLQGIQIRNLVGGSVLVETVFNIPGMGRLLVNAALSKDFLVVQGSVLMLGLVVCLANLLVDISYGWLDPRTKYD
jgi:peptide/nickel transport system permease protein